MQVRKYILYMNMGIENSVELRITSAQSLGRLSMPVYGGIFMLVYCRDDWSCRIEGRERAPGFFRLADLPSHRITLQHEYKKLIMN